MAEDISDKMVASEEEKHDPPPRLNAAPEIPAITWNLDFPKRS